MYYSRAKTSCTMALTMLKGKSFCSMAGMVTRYSVPCTLNFGIRLRTVATMPYGNWGFAIGVVMLGRLFRGECDSVLRRGLYRTGVKCIMCTQQTTGYIFFKSFYLQSVQQIFSLFSYCTTPFRCITIESNKLIDDDDDDDDSDKPSSDNVSLASAAIGMFPCIIA